ncbi:hypothetical protein LK996_03325 [Lysobacter sp. A6]|uniref:Lipoprotein n=1 Tax=Noviluteimonas lactosilytica TaxID=2888523 RepID=A0ABS8JES4_9GAMM|nr:hypothetical protein [Lysobacter lactosilyticus]MCC8362106.1 hypothetical protein [Lysobacter lactosilyticus]
MIRTTLAAVIAAAALTACASSAASSEDSAMRTIATGTSTTMQQGETVRLPDGATLRFVAVPQDSRCPPNARCIRAGDADLEFVFAIAGGPQATVKANLPEAPSKNMGAWRLTVEDLAFEERPPVTLRIDPAN